MDSSQALVELTDQGDGNIKSGEKVIGTYVRNN
jgi:hypothetical protein